MDAAVQKLLNQCYEDATRLLQENRALLDQIASYLLTKETISSEELMSFVRRPAQEAEPAEAEAKAEATADAAEPAAAPEAEAPAGETAAAETTEITEE